MDEIFAERLSMLIKESELSYKQLADKLGYKSKGTIFKFATKQTTKVGPTTISKLAKIFNVSPDWLAGFTDDKYYNMKK